MRCTDVARRLRAFTADRGVPALRRWEAAGLRGLRPLLTATRLAGTSAAFDARGDRVLWHPAATGVSGILLPMAFRDTPFDRFGDWPLAGCLVALAVTRPEFSLSAAAVTSTDPRAAAKRVPSEIRR